MQALIKILATLTDDRGVIAVPELLTEVRPPTRVERDALGALPFDEAKFRSDAGMLTGTQLVGEDDMTVYERMWLRPSLTVIALEASPLKGSSNQIVPSARARVSLRLVPDMDPDKIAEQLTAHIRRVAPWGVEVSVVADHGAPGWVCAPEGPAFEAAKRALTKGFGQPATLIGCGGSIPFVGPFAQAFGGAPALLVGLEDPICKAHSENESLNLDDWRKAMKSAVTLYRARGRPVKVRARLERHLERQPGNASNRAFITRPPTGDTLGQAGVHDDAQGGRSISPTPEVDVALDMAAPAVLVASIGAESSDVTRESRRASGPRARDRQHAAHLSAPRRPRRPGQVHRQGQSVALAETPAHPDGRRARGHVPPAPDQPTGHPVERQLPARPRRDGPAGGEPPRAHRATSVSTPDR